MSGPAQLLVINVLPTELYHDCRIQGTINVPLEELASYAESLNKEQPIVVYCGSYFSSVTAKAWHLLHDMGFSNIWAYEGGINEWKFAGLPTEGACTSGFVLEPVGPLRGHDTGVRQISKQELFDLMKKHGLL
ncbi:MAG TPA: rhodanese-like domain-containing protein [Candidatus Bathyarchaeia archaeon]|nr:rhodanese-like domain-containing protein [Candidatus Bathyarchaeia archaeon]